MGELRTDLRDRYQETQRRKKKSEEHQKWVQSHALNESQIKEVEILYRDCIEKEITHEKALRLGELLSNQRFTFHHHQEAFESWIRENLSVPVRSVRSFVRYQEAWERIGGKIKKKKPKSLQPQGGFFD